MYLILCLQFTLFHNIQKDNHPLSYIIVHVNYYIIVRYIASVGQAGGLVMRGSRVLLPAILKCVSYT
jgi:hypothetical protein